MSETNQPKLGFDREVLDQIAIFNEIIAYIDKNAIMNINSKTNQYFETIDFKYEYVDKKLTITVKPSSAIFPKIQSLKMDVLNKFDVQISNLDEINSKIDAMRAGFAGYQMNVYGNPCTLENRIDKLFEYARKIYIEKIFGRNHRNTHDREIRLGNSFDSIPSDSILYEYLRHLEIISNSSMFFMNFNAEIRSVECIKKSFIHDYDLILDVRFIAY